MRIFFSAVNLRRVALRICLTKSLVITFSFALAMTSIGRDDGAVKFNPLQGCNPSPEARQTDVRRHYCRSSCNADCLARLGGVFVTSARMIFERLPVTPKPSSAALLTPR